MDALITLLKQNKLIDDNGNIILEKYENGRYQSIDQETFNIFFGDVSLNPTYEALSGGHAFLWAEEQLTKTAAELGYQKYFDEWKAKGIL